MHHRTDWISHTNAFLVPVLGVMAGTDVNRIQQLNTILVARAPCFDVVGRRACRTDPERYVSGVV